MSRTSYQLKVSLRHIRPMIWRRLRVPSDIRLGDLHAVLQIAFGWEDCHLHQFVVGRDVYGPPDPDGFDDRTQSEDVRLDQVARQKSKLLYEYDFGDSWRHDVVVERVKPARSANLEITCVAGRRAGPPEDSGGPWGYADLLAIATDTEDPDQVERREWLGPDWDPELFEVDAVNERLASLARRLAPRVTVARGGRSKKTKSSLAD